MLGLCCGAALCAEGAAVPDMNVKDETGKEVKLASFKDKNAVVVFFFPKAGTPG
jgi:peroxiredoxin